MTKKLTLLVIDDEPQVTSSIRRILVKEGFEVIALNDPRKVEDHLLSLLSKNGEKAPII